MQIIKWLLAVAFLGSVAWLVAQPGYESAIAAVTSLSALVAALFGEGKTKRHANQKQSVSENAIGIQAGRDVSIGNIHADRKV